MSATRFDFTESNLNCESHKTTERMGNNPKQPNMEYINKPVMLRGYIHKHAPFSSVILDLRTGSEVPGSQVAAKRVTSRLK